VKKITPSLGFTSIQPRFHAMVINGQWKTQNSNDLWKQRCKKMNQKLHFKIHISSKTSLKISCHWTTKKKFSHHLTSPKWWSKMDLIQWAIEIHSCHLMVTKFNRCRQMATKFRYRAIMVTKNFSITTCMWQWKTFRSPPHVAMTNPLIATMYLPSPPTPCFFSFFVFPPW